MSGIVHVEIKVTNIARAKKFYGKLLGWKFFDMMPGYVLFEAGKGAVGGAFDKVKKIAKGDATLAYFEVKSMDVSLDLVKKLRGKIVTPKTEIPGGRGAMAHFRDSEGNLVGLWSKK